MSATAASAWMRMMKSKVVLAKVLLLMARLRGKASGGMSGRVYIVRVWLTSFWLSCGWVMLVKVMMVIQSAKDAVIRILASRRMNVVMLVISRGVGGWVDWGLGVRGQGERWCYIDAGLAVRGWVGCHVGRGLGLGRECVVGEWLIVWL